MNGEGILKNLTPSKNGTGGELWPSKLLSLSAPVTDDTDDSVVQRAHLDTLVTRNSISSLSTRLDSAVCALLKG